MNAIRNPIEFIAGVIGILLCLMKEELGWIHKHIFFVSNESHAHIDGIH